MPLLHCYRNLETIPVHWCRLWLQKFYWVPETERVGEMDGFLEGPSTAVGCALYIALCVCRKHCLRGSATHGASILFPFLRLEDCWWRGDGKMLTAIAWRGPERKHLPDMTWWLSELMVSQQLKEHHTKPRPSTFQSGGERGSWAPTPNWRAMPWWLLRRGRVSFLSGCVSWQEGQPSSRGCLGDEDFRVLRGLCSEYDQYTFYVCMKFPKITKNITFEGYSVNNEEVNHQSISYIKKYPLSLLC